MRDPDYHNLGDHTETVQIDYDPQRISYEHLLRIFWDSHHPDQRSWNRQYMNAVFFHDDAQRQMAEQTKAAIEMRTGRSVRTEVLPLRAFYRAEDYHQKYLLKRRSALTRELGRIYPQEDAFVDSTAAARMNGYAGGYGTRDQLTREMPLLGLSPEGQERLYKLVR